MDGETYLKCCAVKARNRMLLNHLKQRHNFRSIADQISKWKNSGNKFLVQRALTMEAIAKDPKRPRPQRPRGPPIYTSNGPCDSYVDLQLPNAKFLFMLKWAKRFRENSLSTSVIAMFEGVDDAWDQLSRAEKDLYEKETKELRAALEAGNEKELKEFRELQEAARGN